MKPIVFEHQIVVEIADIDDLKHVNNIVYLRYVQEVAGLHWTSVVDEVQLKTLVWVARRHEIDYLRQAFLSDILTVRTWVEAFTGVTSLRRCEIYKGETCITQSKTTWVAIDPITFKPQRIQADLANLFFE